MTTVASPALSGTSLSTNTGVLSSLQGAYDVSPANTNPGSNEEVGAPHVLTTGERLQQSRPSNASVPHGAATSNETLKADDPPQRRRGSESIVNGTTDSQAASSSKSSQVVKPKSTNAFVNIGKKLLSSGQPPDELLNPGLYNLGNSCYFNSTLQGLLSTSLLESMIKFRMPADVPGHMAPQRSPALTNGRGGQYEISPVPGMELCMSFIRTLEKGWELRDARKRSSMSARELLQRIGSKYDQYLDFRQQDGHELLRHLLDGMYMEEWDVIKKRQPPPPPKRSKRKVANGSTNGLISEPPLQPIDESAKLVPFVDQIFGGKLASMLICGTCKHVSHTYEDFMDLSLSIRPENDKENKKLGLKALAQKFRRQAGKAVPRPFSNPPSPRLKPQDFSEPPRNIDERRRSVEVPESRPDSDPDDQLEQNNLKVDTSRLSIDNSDTKSIGRRLSVKLRKSLDRSGLNDAVKAMEPSSGIVPGSTSQKKKEEKQKSKLKQEYLAQIMADASSKPNPLALLRAQQPSSTNESIVNATGNWLRLNTSGMSLADCLRQFTAVEALDGDNMVGCSKCWYAANPGYVRKKRKQCDSDSSSSSSESSDEEETSSSKTSRTNGTIVTSVASTSTTSLSTAEITTSLSSSVTSVTSVKTLPSRQIPSISMTSPTDSSPPTLNVTHHPHSRSVSGNSMYLTPSSSPRASLKRTDSSSAEDSEGAASDLSLHKPKVKLASPKIPKSQRVLLRRAYKRYLIAVPPPVLVIHLKRFQQVTKSPIAIFGNLKKIDDFVSFPEYLDMKPYITPRREEYGLRPPKIPDLKGSYDQYVMYRLYGVVVHIGNMLGGHYIAYVALPSNAEKSGQPRKWSFISDHIVRTATVEEVLAAKAYLCFYERLYGEEAAAAANLSNLPIKKR